MDNKLQASRSDPWLNCQSKYVQIFPRTTKTVEQKKKKSVSFQREKRKFVYQQTGFSYNSRIKVVMAIYLAEKYSRVRVRIPNYLDVCVSVNNACFAV